MNWTKCWTNWAPLRTSWWKTTMPLWSLPKRKMHPEPSWSSMVKPPSFWDETAPVIIWLLGRAINGQRVCAELAKHKQTETSYFSAHPRVYIGRVPSDVTKKDFLDLFSHYGQVVDVLLRQDYAFVVSPFEKKLLDSLCFWTSSQLWGISRELGVQRARICEKGHRWTQRKLLERHEAPSRRSQAKVPRGTLDLLFQALHWRGFIDVQKERFGWFVWRVGRHHGYSFEEWLRIHRMDCFIDSQLKGRV